jgi:hypothetical protein
MSGASSVIVMTVLSSSGIDCTAEPLSVGRLEIARARFDG